MRPDHRGASGRPPTPTRLRGLALVSLSAVFGLLACEAWRNAPRGLDQDVASRVEHLRRLHPNVTRGFLLITRLGDWPRAAVVTGAAALLIAVMARKERPRRRAGAAVCYALSVASSWLLGSAIKQVVRRERPPPEWLVESGYSFPSGHSLFGAVCFGLLAVAAWRRSDLGLASRVAVGLLCLGLIAALAASRVWLGVHYLSDVTGGVILGLSWVVLSWGVRDAWGNRWRDPIA